MCAPISRSFLQDPDKYDVDVVAESTLFLGENDNCDANEDGVLLNKGKGLRIATGSEFPSS